MDKRRMCPHCRAFITSSDRTCPYCGEQVGARAVEVRNPAGVLGGLIPASKITTSMILLVNIGAFIATNYAYWGGALLEAADKNSRAVLLGHEWWRLITAGFLHGGIIHIGMNMWVLNDLGAEVERTFGTARFLIIYFCATVFGFLLSCYWTLAPSVGASAGLFGLIGAMIAFGMRNRTEVGRQIRSFYIKWAIYGAALGLLPGFHIDNAAHVGGLAAGLGVAYLAGTPVHSSRPLERIWQMLALVCVLLTVLSFYMVWLHLGGTPQTVDGTPA